MLFPVRYACAPVLIFFLTGFSFNSSHPATTPDTGQTTAPNIVLIVADDMGWSDLSCYGNTFHETPRLDQLASAGIRFTNAYAACPVCSPTRASLLTGKYPARLQLTDWIPGRQHTNKVKNRDQLLPPDFLQQLPLEENTLAEALKTKGYVTASIGKWHLGTAPFYPQHQGFDVNIAGRHQGSPPSYFFPYATPKKDYQLTELAATGKEGEYLTDRLNQEAIEFIEQNQQKPFFLYLPHYAVHIPIQAKEELTEKYTKKQVDTTKVFKNPRYAAMVESLDTGVGSIIDALKKAGLYENTIIIFTSDNGGLSVAEGRYTPATLNTPLRDGKGHLSEGGIRVPLIVKWHNASGSNQVADMAVSSIDFFPTLTEAAGVTPAATGKVDGVSLLPYFQKKQPIRRETLYWHYPHYSNQGGRPGGAIRKGNYKLIEHYEDNRIELFDLAKDISETNNLAAQMPQKARELQQDLHNWRKSVQARMPVRNPGYNPDAVKNEKK